MNTPPPPSKTHLNKNNLFKVSLLAKQAYFIKMIGIFLLFFAYSCSDSIVENDSFEKDIQEVIELLSQYNDLLSNNIDSIKHNIDHNLREIRQIEEEVQSILHSKQTTSPEIAFEIQSRLHKLLFGDKLKSEINDILHYISIYDDKIVEIALAQTQPVVAQKNACEAQLVLTMSIIQATYISSVIACNAVVPCQVAALMIKLAAEANAALTYYNCIEGMAD